MNSISKKLPSTSFGKISSDILLNKKAANGNVQPRLENSFEDLRPRMTRSQSIIDSWISGAIDKRQTKSQDRVVLHLPVVLKTLQKLRSSDQRTSYFALLNKIQSSRIQWLSQTGKQIKSDKSAPIEFYNEVSTMLYRISLRCDPQDLEALSKFVLNLQDSYERSLQQRRCGPLKHSVKFYRNCSMVIVKTGSLSLLLENLQKIPPERSTLKKLIELAFYQETSQMPKVLALLNHEFLADDAAAVDIEEIAIFFPLFFSIMQTFISHGAEDICKRLLNKIKNDWRYEIDDHHRSLLIELCQKYAADEVFLAIDQGYSHSSSALAKWKMLQSQLSWEDFMSCLYGLDVDLFKESQDLDFLHHKLSSVGPTFKEWRLFLQQHKFPKNANPSLQSYAINSVLVHLVANRNLGFVLSILEYMVYEMDYGQQFVDAGKLVGQSNYSGFHLLIKAISNSSSSVLTSSVFFKFFEDNHSQFKFKFTTNDFYCMMKTCLFSVDHHCLYFFLFHYIKTMGPSLYVGSQENSSWVLPSRIESLLKVCVAGQKGDDRAIEIVQDARHWFMENRSNPKTENIDDIMLKSIFKDEYLPELSIKTLIALEHKFDKNYGERKYSPSIDLRNSRRVQDLLHFLQNHTSL